MGVLCFATLTMPASAQHRLGKDFQVSSRSSVADQSEEDLAFQESGELTVVWRSSGRSRADLVGRNYSASGQAGRIYRIIGGNYTSNPGSYPAVVSAPDAVTVFWKPDVGVIGGLGAIYGQKFSLNGQALSPAFRVTPRGDFEAQFPSAIATPGGYAVVAVEPHFSSSGIFLRLLGTNGFPRSGYIRVNDQVQGLNMGGLRPLAASSDGTLVTVWATLDSSTIRARRVSPTGALLGDEIEVDTVDVVNCPSVAAAPGGKFVVVWRAVGRDTAYLGSIRGQLFAADGTRVGEEFRINGSTTDDTRCVSIAADARGNFVVVWENEPSTVPACIRVMGRLYRKDGTPVGPEFSLSADSSQCREERPQVAFGPDGIFAATWTRFRPGYFNDVYAARFSACPDLGADGGCSDHAAASR